MIKRAGLKDLDVVAMLLKSMYQEMNNKAITAEEPYRELAWKHIVQDYVYLLGNKALYIVKDVSVPVVDEKVWDGVSVYIIPEERKGKLLSLMYRHMFDTFEGTIVGMVEPDSSHLEVVTKRHRLIGYLYQMNRS